MWVKEMNVMKDMSVRKFINMNEEDKCDEIYIKSERRKL